VLVPPAVLCPPAPPPRGDVSPCGGRLLHPLRWVLVLFVVPPCGGRLLPPSPLRWVLVLFVVPPCGGRLLPSPPAVDSGVVCCAPLRWALAASLLRWILAPCAGAPPRCCGPDRDQIDDRLETTAPCHTHSLVARTSRGSGHPHAHGSCVRAGTTDVIHSRSRHSAIHHK